MPVQFLKSALEPFHSFLILPKYACKPKKNPASQYRVKKNYCSGKGIQFRRDESSAEDKFLVDWRMAPTGGDRIIHIITNVEIVNTLQH